MIILTDNIVFDMPLNTLVWIALATFVPWLFFAVYVATDNNIKQIPAISRS